MKVTLEYDFPVEEAELQTALDGYKWKSVIEGVDQRLRNMVKYDEIEFIEIDTIRKLISEIISDWDLQE